MLSNFAFYAPVLCFWLLSSRAVSAAEDVWFCNALPKKSGGICNAFCNAKECHLHQPYDTSCSVLLEQFGRATEGGIPPCLSTVAPTIPPTEVDDCDVTITLAENFCGQTLDYPGGKVCVKENILCSDGDGAVLMSNTNLVCSGNTITGLSGLYGVAVLGTESSVINCIIEKFVFGIYVAVSGNSIVNCVTRNNVVGIFYEWTSSDNEIKCSKSYENTFDGAVMSGGNVAIIGSEFNNNLEHGLYFYTGSSDYSVSCSQIYNNVVDDIYIAETMTGNVVVNDSIVYEIEYHALSTGTVTGNYASIVTLPETCPTLCLDGVGTY